MPRGRKKVAKATKATKKTKSVETAEAPKPRRPRVDKSDDAISVMRTKTIVKDTLVPVMSETTIKRETAYDASELGWTPGKFPASLKHNGTTYTKDTTHTQPASKIVAYVNYVKRDRKGDLAEIIPVFNA